MTEQVDIEAIKKGLTFRIKRKQNIWGEHIRWEPWYKGHKLPYLGSSSRRVYGPIPETNIVVKVDIGGSQSEREAIKYKELVAMDDPIVPYLAETYDWGEFTKTVKVKSGWDGRPVNASYAVNWSLQEAMSHSLDYLFGHDEIEAQYYKIMDLAAAANIGDRGANQLMYDHDGKLKLVDYGISSAW